MLELVACAPCVDPVDVMIVGALFVGAVAAALALGVPGLAVAGAAAFGLGLGIGHARAERAAQAASEEQLSDADRRWIENVWRPVHDAEHVSEVLEDVNRPELGGTAVGRNDDTKALYWPEVREEGQRLLDEITEERRRKAMLGD